MKIDVDVRDLYHRYFSKSDDYYVSTKPTKSPKTEPIVYKQLTDNISPKGAIQLTNNEQPLNKAGLYGKDIWFPIQLWQAEDNFLDIDYCTTNVTMSKTIIRTAVAERKGTVKEMFNVDDYKFTIKGMLIGENRQFPESQITQLKNLFETTQPVMLHGGYVELFLIESTRVAITSLEFPDTEGKAVWARPFVMTCESDFITDLKIEDYKK